VLDQKFELLAGVKTSVWLHSAFGNCFFDRKCRVPQEPVDVANGFVAWFDG